MSISALTAPGVQALSCRGTSRSSIQYSRSRGPLRIQPRAFILVRRSYPFYCLPFLSFDILPVGCVLSC
eukprot:scaffold101_cov373-Prasinococcus_capsulatus_cf.AAC.22